MKLSLDSIGYGGYFTAPGESATLEDAMGRAARFGYDAVCVYAHRPIGFPMDIDQERRANLRNLAGELDLEFGAVGLLHQLPRREPCPSVSAGEGDSLRPIGD